MPLARILTMHPDEAADFAHQLEQAGFQVEIVNPNEEQLAPADLEIEFAVCEQRQVLQRAAAIAGQLRTEVVVFPGAVPQFQEPVVEVFAEPNEVMEHEALQPEVEPVAQQTFAMASSLNPVPEAADASEATAGPRKPSIFNRVATSLHNHLQRLQPTLTNSLATLKGASAAVASAATKHARALPGAVQARLAHARQAWRERRAELEQHRTALQQERQKQAELAAAERKQRQAALMEDKEFQLLRAEKERLLAEVKHLKAVLGQTRWASAREMLVKLLRRQQPAGRLRGALAGAATISFLFLVGMVLANFQAITPVSSHLDNGSIQEQTPFGPATVHGAPGVTVGGAPPAKHTPQAPPRVQLQPQKPRHASSAKQQSAWHHFQKPSTRTQNSDTADDVVVRHFGKTKPSPTPQQQAKLKRYSDE